MIDALTKGADGVLICGGHHGDCHYQERNFKAEERGSLMLADFGIEEERFRLEWISAAEGQGSRRWQEFTDQLRTLGLSPYRS